MCIRDRAGKKQTISVKLGKTSWAESSEPEDPFAPGNQQNFQFKMDGLDGKLRRLVGPSRALGLTNLYSFCLLYTSTGHPLNGPQQSQHHIPAQVRHVRELFGPGQNPRQEPQSILEGLITTLTLLKPGQHAC